MHRLTLDDATVERILSEAGLRGASAVVAALDGAGRVDVRAEAAIYPASMIKVPIAVALARLCATGAHALDDVARVEAGDVTPNDAPSPFVLGYAATLRACACAMLSTSDNVATNVLIDVLGRDAVTAECRALGLTGTAVRRKLSGALPLIEDREATGRNAHPPGDAARLLELIAREAESAPSFVYEALLAQYWNDKLSRGWRPGDRFAHKTGDTDDTSHDGGILSVDGGGRYVVVVYTDLPSNSETDARFATFARGLRSLLT